MNHVQMIVRHKLVDFRKERVESLGVLLLARRADNCRQKHPSRCPQIPQRETDGRTYWRSCGFDPARRFRGAGGKGQVPGPKCCQSILVRPRG